MKDGENHSTSEQPRTTVRRTVIDALCLVIVTVLSALPYIRDLGFYIDDWGIIAGFSIDGRSGLAAAISDFRDRPVQGVYLVALFNLFGLHPLGYHIVNSMVLAACAALFFLLLLRLRFTRQQSFAAALIFIMLPQLSTVRVWYAAFQIPLSLMLMLVSMHCQLSFARHRGIGWLVAAILTALLSIGAYEIFAPLLIGLALALGFVTWRDASGTARNQTLVAALVVIGTVFLAAIYKLTISSRVGPLTDPNRYILGLRQLSRLDYDWRVESSLNIIATPQAHFWAPVRGWWTGAQDLVSGNASAEVTGLAILIAALAWWRLKDANQYGGAPTSKRLLFVGAATFLLGNVTFLIVPAVVFTSTGIGNRVHVAAALGVAILFSAGISMLTKAAPPRSRGIVFSVLIVTISAAAFVRLASIERYWAEVPAIQKQILDAARVDLRDVPANSTIILNGVCPYHGPAVVFESAYNVSGALTLALARPIAGDVVSSRMIRSRSGLRTSMYEEPMYYPYGRHLYIYNPSSHQLYRLINAQAAAQYFAGSKSRPCPGYVARGVEV